MSDIVPATVSRGNLLGRLWTQIEKASTRTLFGWALTAMWLIAIAWMLLPEMDTFLAQPLNEKGDFIAGAAAPLAFLWLVIGYFQQGEELQQNTQALLMQGQELRLQVVELRASVQAQQELAQTAQKSLALSESDRITRTNAEIRAVQPVFLYAGQAVSPHDDGGLEVDISITNTGRRATKVSATISGAFRLRLDEERPIEWWEPDVSHRFTVLVDPFVNAAGPSILRFSYLDEHGRSRYQEYGLVRSSNGYTLDYSYEGASYDPREG